MSIDVIIIDDDPTSIFLHQVVVKKTGLTMSPLGFSRGWDALDHLDALEHWDNPCILLVDIDMPGINGLDMRKQLDQVPACIFITSYPEYALESFEAAALDFLVNNKTNFLPGDILRHEAAPNDLSNSA